MSKKISLKINGQDINFSVEPEHIERWIDETLPNSKCQPMHNFLVRTVVPDDKEKLTEIITGNPGATMLIGDKVTNAATKMVNIELVE